MLSIQRTREICKSIFLLYCSYRENNFFMYYDNKKSRQWDKDAYFITSFGLLVNMVFNKAVCLIVIYKHLVIKVSTVL